MAGPYFTKSGSGTKGSGTFRGEYVVSSTYAVGDRVVPTRAYATAAAKGYIYECTTAGTTSGTQPTWVYTTPGTSTTTDGAVFTCRDCTTWANANMFVDYIANNRVAAGETLWASHAGAETSAVTVTINFPGTLASPCKILCGNDGAEPPTSLATTGSVATTANAYLFINGSAYVYGLTFSCATASTGANFAFCSDGTTDSQTYDNCAFVFPSSFSGVSYQVGMPSTNDMGAVSLIDSTISFGHTGQYIALGMPFNWKGGSVNGSIFPTSLFKGYGSNRGEGCLISGVDLSALGTGKNLFDVTSITAGNYIIESCKLGTGVAIKTGTWGAPGAKISVENCSATDTNYTFYYDQYEGVVREEIVIVKTGGASDGTTGYSMKMTSSANAEYPLIMLETPVLPAKWNSTLSSITVTVDILHDSVTALNDNDVWLEVEYLGTTGFPKSVFIDDAAANVITAAAAQTTSTATWTTTGITNVNKQKLEVTFTPQEVGYLKAKVMLAKASYSIYVDPVLQIS